MNPALDSACPMCGVPADASFFDDSSIVDPPAPGGEVVLARFQLHPNYCGALLYFAQFFDDGVTTPAPVRTEGLEWEIRCNGLPRDPYRRFDRVINPWGLSGFPIHLRLEEGSLTELVVRRLPPRPGTILSLRSALVGGRLLGRYWYNPAYGSTVPG
jgi:hypothetical protein